MPSIKFLISFVLLLGFLSIFVVDSAKSTAHAENKFAIVIGINKYEKTSYSTVPELKYAVKDAQDIADILKNELGYDKKKIMLLCNHLAKRVDILNSYYILKDEMNSDSEFILYFAGHGIRDNVQRIGYKGSTESYWMTYDTDFSKPEVNGLRLADVLRLVKMLPASRKLLILDHCYAGDLIEIRQQPERTENIKSRSISSDSSVAQPLGFIPLDRTPYLDDKERALINEKVWTLPAEDQTIAIIASSRDLAYEHDILQHGLLTWAVVQALTKDKNRTDAANDNHVGNGTITLQEFLKSVQEIKNEEIKKLKDQNLQGIDRQKFSFQLIEKNAHISGWPLLKINLQIEIEPILEFLEEARNLGLETVTYHFVKEILNKVKNDVDYNGKIADDNCEGREVYIRLSEGKKSIDYIGGINTGNIHAVEESLQDIMKVAIAQCKKD